MNISDQPIYALIALPTIVNLKFLDSQEALEYFATINSQIEKEKIHLPHHVFTRLLYAEKLLEHDMFDEAKAVIKNMDVEKIENTIQKIQAQNLSSKVYNKQDMRM
jgi:oligoribonuclease NrnB/cAMP/cGMP phosphodiesterase (DHH superfamily)